MKYVEFQHCALNSEFSGIAHEIALSVNSEKEAWAEVDKLDAEIREAIYDRGNFLEHDTDAIPPSQNIVDYLRRKGKMSGRDICEDLGVEEIDLSIAEANGAITRVEPPANASSFPWFDVVR